MQSSNSYRLTLDDRLATAYNSSFYKPLDAYTLRDKLVPDKDIPDDTISDFSSIYIPSHFLHKKSSILRRIKKIASKVRATISKIEIR